MSMRGKSDFLTIGKVGRAHGLKGELCVISYADSPLLFEKLTRVYLKKDAWRFPRKFKIYSYREAQDKLYLSLQGVAGRDEVKNLQGAEVWVRFKDLPDRDPDDIYLFELVGFSVFLADDSLLGHITDVQAETAQEVWTIKNSQGKEIMFPVAEQFVLDIDAQAKSVQIDPPAGLIEIYTEEGSE